MKADIYEILDSNDIRYTKYAHTAVFTVEDANKLHDDIPGSHTKNLFLRNKDKSQYYLLIIASNKRADLKKVAEELGEKKLHFGKPEKLRELLGLEPGSVSILGLVNDSEHKVRVLIDKELWESECINAHPNTNTATLTLTQENFRKFLKFTGHTATVLNCE